MDVWTAMPKFGSPIACVRSPALSQARRSRAAQSDRSFAVGCSKGIFRPPERVSQE